MVGGRLEDGIQIDDIRAECALDVAEFLVDARQVAAKEHLAVAVLGLGEDARAPRVLLGCAACVCVTAIGHVVGRVSVIEAVWEDLVHHAVLHPIRGL